MKNCQSTKMGPFITQMTGQLFTFDLEVRSPQFRKYLVPSRTKMNTALNEKIRSQNQGIQPFNSFQSQIILNHSLLVSVKAFRDNAINYKSWVFTFQLQNNMNKTLIVFLAVCCALAVAEVPCWGEDCAYNVQGNPDQKAELVDIVRDIDVELKRMYWYYLRGSRRLFQANLDTPDRYVHFFIYRNRIGTFLAITSWYHETQASELNTFVRLGNGYDKDIETPYSPVDINPFVISLRLKHGEFLIEIDENGDIICREDGYCPQQEEEGSDGVITITDEKVAKLDQHVRDTYWYYLDKAAIIHTESIPTNQRVYAVFTYVNIIGTFLVITSCDLNDVMQINTFVRLGAGARNPTEVKPIELRPSIEHVSME